MTTQTHNPHIFPQNDNTWKELFDIKRYISYTLVSHKNQSIDNCQSHNTQHRKRDFINLEKRMVPKSPIEHPNKHQSVFIEDLLQV